MLARAEGHMGYEQGLSLKEQQCLKEFDRLANERKVYNAKY